MTRVLGWVLVLSALIATGSWHGAVAQEPVATPLTPESGADVAQYRANAARTGEVPGPGPQRKPSRKTHQAPPFLRSAHRISSDKPLSARSG